VLASRTTISSGLIDLPSNGVIHLLNLKTLYRGLSTNTLFEADRFVCSDRL
jgi:hypothetical protein